MFSPLKLATVASVALTLSFSLHAAEVTGAGASFPAPVYAKWADAYQKATNNKINYQSIGSGGGIKQITAKTVDFGASDSCYSGTLTSERKVIQGRDLPPEQILQQRSVLVLA